MKFTVQSLVSTLFFAACGANSAASPDAAVAADSAADSAIDATTSADVQATVGPFSIGQGETVLVSSPTGAKFAAVVDPGILEADLPEGSTNLQVHAGYVPDAKANVVAQVTDNGSPSNLTVSFAIQPLKWAENVTWDANGPEAREHGALILDTLHNRLILLGGSGYAPQLTPLGDAWAFDLDKLTWTKLAPTGDVLAPAGSRRVAQIPGQPLAYLSGGYAANQAAINELVRVDFNEIQPKIKVLTQKSPPAARSLHAFGYDPQTDRFYLFGGVGAVAYSDTWSLQITSDTGTWTNLKLKPAPSPRYGFFAAMDQKNGRLIVYSGAQNQTKTDPVNAAQDTWALDTRSQPPAWTQILDGKGENEPPGRRNGCAVWDASGPRLLVFGGTPDAKETSPGFYLLDARPGKEAWTLLNLPGEPDLRSSGIGIYDPKSRRSFLGFGNSSSGVYADLTPIGY